MRIDEVRRRNRRRAFALALVAAVNYWVILSGLFMLGVWAWSEKAEAHIDARVLVSIGSVGSAIAVMAFVWSRLRALGPQVAKRFRATPVDKESHPRVVNLLEELSVAIGGAPVAAKVITDPAPNALTVGTREGETLIILTTGLLDGLTRDELEAVLAVQLCAIRRLDVMLNTVVSACAEGAIDLHRSARDDWKDPRSWPLIVLTAPTMFVGRLIREHASRTLDFGADAMAVSITRHPEALVRALTKLHDDPQVIAHRNRDLADLWFEPVPDPADAPYGAEFGRYALQDRIARVSNPPTA